MILSDLLRCFDSFFLLFIYSRVYKKQFAGMLACTPVGYKQEHTNLSCKYSKRCIPLIVKDVRNPMHKRGQYDISRLIC